MMRPLPAPPRRAVALVLMIVAPALWSIAGVLTRHVAHAAGFELVFWRSLFAGLLVAAALGFWQGRDAFRSVAAAGMPGLLSAAMWAAMFTAFMLALTLTSTARVLVAQSVSPLITALAAWWFLREPVSRVTWFAILVASAGMAAMFREGLSDGAPGALAGTLVALCVPLVAAVNVVVLRRTGGHIDLIPAVMTGAFLSALVSLPLALPLQADARDIGILAVLGVFQLGIPCVLYVIASRALSAPELALLALIEVLLGPLWAWWGANEVPGGGTLAGGALVLVALAGNQLAGMRRGRGPENPSR
jgi:drug/metabolite transporter (DMT)-like permease